MAEADRPSRPSRAHVTLRADLAAWADAEAGRRVCHRNVVIDRAVELLQEAVDKAPDLVDLPDGFRSTT